MFGVTCTCSWLELFVVIWSWVKNDAAPFLGVGGLVGGYLETTINHVIAMFKKSIPVQTIAEIVKLPVQETEKIIRENT